MGRSMAFGDGRRIIGIMTFVYGVGQMIGPTVAGIMADKTGSYHAALYFASLVLLIAFLILVTGQLKYSGAAEKIAAEKSM